MTWLVIFVAFIGWILTLRWIADIRDEVSELKAQLKKIREKR